MLARRLANPKPIAQTKENQRLAADFLLFVRTLTRKAVRPHRGQMTQTRLRGCGRCPRWGHADVPPPSAVSGAWRPKLPLAATTAEGERHGRESAVDAMAVETKKEGGIPPPRLGVMPACRHHPDGAGTPLSAKAHTCASREKGGCARQTACGRREMGACALASHLEGAKEASIFRTYFFPE